VRERKRIERNETKEGIITLRDICGRAEIEIRDEGFRCRRRAQSADTKRGTPRYTQRHRLDETPDRFVVSARLNKHLFGGGARAWCIIRCARQRAGESVSCYDTFFFLSSQVISRDSLGRARFTFLNVSNYLCYLAITSRDRF